MRQRTRKIIWNDIFQPTGHIFVLLPEVLFWLWPNCLTPGNSLIYLCTPSLHYQTIALLSNNFRPSTRLPWQLQLDQLQPHQPTKLPNATLPKWTWLWHWDGERPLQPTLQQPGLWDFHHQHWRYWGHSWHRNLYELSWWREWDGDKLGRFFFNRVVGP